MCGVVKSNFDRNVYRNICGNKPLKVTLRGLEIMNDDPSEVHVLYAKCVLEDSTLQDVADMVAKHFGDSGMSLVKNSPCFCVRILNDYSLCRLRKEHERRAGEASCNSRQH